MNGLPDNVSSPLPTLLSTSKTSKLSSWLSGSSRKRAAILTVPLSGHQRPALAVAREVARRGIAVDILVSAAGAKANLVALGEEPLITVHIIDEGEDLISRMDWQRVACSTGRLGGSKLALMHEIGKVFSHISDVIPLWRAMQNILRDIRPDIIIADHAMRQLQEWAENKGIPSIILHTPFYLAGPPTGCAVVDEEFELGLIEYLKKKDPFAKMEAIRDQLDLPARKFKQQLGEGAAGSRPVEYLAPHTFVFCEPELLNARTLPPRTHAVGACLTLTPEPIDGTLRQWLDEALSLGESVLYVAFGTLANGFCTPDAVGTLLEAFVGLGVGWRVLWSLPIEHHTSLELCGRHYDPYRVRVEPFVEQQAALCHQAVKLFFTHGGQSSVHEALFGGIPLVCMPLFCDQYEMAEAIFTHGLGTVYHKDELLAGKSALLSTQLLSTASDAHVIETSRRYAHLMRIRGGCKRAGDVVESILFVGPDFEELWRGMGSCIVSL